MRFATTRLIAILVIVVGLFPGASLQADAALVVVPAGNRNASQPPIPAGSVSRTRSTDGSFQAKYEKIRDMIARDRQLQAKIKAAAARYRIDPVHIVGALVGEHTYNVDALDRLQTYLVKAASYLGSDLTFAHDGEKVSQFVQRPEFADCSNLKDSYDLWSCREDIWNSRFRGKNVGGKSWPNDRFGRVFFQPLYAGQTFGLGQLNPLTALQVTDMVSRTSGYRKLDPDRAPEIYKSIMDPDSTLQYMAAVIRTSIDAYANIAGLDISGNPGITATLYNLGNVRQRAQALVRKNAGRTKPAMPEENYYGWLVNTKLSELAPLVH